MTHCDLLCQVHGLEITRRSKSQDKLEKARKSAHSIGAAGGGKNGGEESGKSEEAIRGF